MLSVKLYVQNEIDGHRLGPSSLRSSLIPENAGRALAHCTRGPPSSAAQRSAANLGDILGRSQAARAPCGRARGPRPTGSRRGGSEAVCSHISKLGSTRSSAGWAAKTPLGVRAAPRARRSGILSSRRRESWAAAALSPVPRTRAGPRGRSRARGTFWHLHPPGPGPGPPNLHPRKSRGGLAYRAASRPRLRQSGPRGARFPGVWAARPPASGISPRAPGRVSLGRPQCPSPLPARS